MKCVPRPPPARTPRAPSVSLPALPAETRCRGASCSSRARARPHSAPRAEPGFRALLRPRHRGVLIVTPKPPPPASRGPARASLRGRVRTPLLPRFHGVELSGSPPPTSTAAPARNASSVEASEVGGLGRAEADPWPGEGREGELHVLTRPRTLPRGVERPRPGVLSLPERPREGHPGSIRDGASSPLTGTPRAWLCPRLPTSAAPPGEGSAWRFGARCP